MRPNTICAYEMGAEMRYWEHVLTGLKIWCLSPQASEEDRNSTAQQILVHVLRQGHSEEAVDWDLEVPGMQEDGTLYRVTRQMKWMKADTPGDCRRSVHSGYTCGGCDTVDYQASAGDCGGVDGQEAMRGVEFRGTMAQLLCFSVTGWRN